MLALSCIQLEKKNKKMKFTIVLSVFGLFASCANVLGMFGQESTNLEETAPKPSVLLNSADQKLAYTDPDRAVIQKLQEFNREFELFKLKRQDFEKQLQDLKKQIESLQQELKEKKKEDLPTPPCYPKPDPQEEIEARLFEREWIISKIERLQRERDDWMRYLQGYRTCEEGESKKSEVTPTSREEYRTKRLQAPREVQRIESQLNELRSVLESLYY